MLLESHLEDRRISTLDSREEAEVEGTEMALRFDAMSPVIGIDESASTVQERVGNLFRREDAHDRDHLRCEISGSRILGMRPVEEGGTRATTNHHRSRAT